MKSGIYVYVSRLKALCRASNDSNRRLNQDLNDNRKVKSHKHCESDHNCLQLTAILQTHCLLIESTQTFHSLIALLAKISFDSNKHKKTNLNENKEKTHIFESLNQSVSYFLEFTVGWVFRISFSQFNWNSGQKFQSFVHHWRDSRFSLLSDKNWLKVLVRDSELTFIWIHFLQTHYSLLKIVRNLNIYFRISELLSPKTN